MSVELIPTGVAVRKGDVLTFNATGEIRLSTDASDIATPTGAKSQRRSQNAYPWAMTARSACHWGNPRRV